MMAFEEGESNTNPALPDAWKTALERFDAAWQSAPPPRIEAFLLNAEAAVNLLTNPALDPFGKIPEFKFCAARVTQVAAHAA